MDAVNNMLVVGMAGRKINIYDLRRMEKPIQERESSLRFMTRALACNPDGEGRSISLFLSLFLLQLCLVGVQLTFVVMVGYALGSIEGRVAVEYFDPSPDAQAKKYAFKCHRKAVDGADHVWAVNSLAFHPVYVLILPSPVTILHSFFTPSSPISSSPNRHLSPFLTF